VLKKILLIILVVTNYSLSNSSTLTTVLNYVIDYDSRAYLALAREKEAKRRARFEAMKERIIAEDLEIALTGSKIGFTIIKAALRSFASIIANPTHSLTYLFGLKNNSLLGNIGLLWLIGWGGYKVYLKGKPYFAKYLFKEPATQPTRLLYHPDQLKNCQREARRYTKLRQRPVKTLYTAHRSSHNGDTRFHSNA